MDHLPAYVALERWAVGRRVVVAGATGPEGPRRLLAAGARSVMAVGAVFDAEPGVDVRPGVPEIPLSADSVDLVVSVESYARLDPKPRYALLREARRVLRPKGFFAAWVEHGPSASTDGIDFWTLEEELAAVFGRLWLVAQIPWSGFSMAPIVDDEAGGEPGLSVNEGLLPEAPPASHYLAIAGDIEPSEMESVPGVDECVLVPVPGASAGVMDALTEELDDLRRDRDTAQRSLDRTKGELERTVEELERESAEAGMARARLTDLERELGKHRAEDAARLSQREHELTDRIEAGRVQAKARADELQDRLDEAQRELNRRAEAQSQTQQLVGELEEKLGRAKQEAEARRAELAEQTRDLQRLQASHAELEQRAVLEHAQLEKLHEDEGRSLDALRQRLTEAQDTLREKETDLAVLTRTVRDQEQALARESERAAGREREIERLTRIHGDLSERCNSVVAEREELARQVDVAIAEREGARQLSARVEAELEQLRRRSAEQEERLATKVEEASRLGGEVQVIRERLQSQDEALAQSRDRAAELTASAAQKVEQGRMLAEIAVDRDRMREELGRRNTEIHGLEERLWQTREEVQKERLDAVRRGAELEMLGDQLTRYREAEQRLTEQVQSLSTEGRKLELEQADLAAKLRSKDGELQRLRDDVRSQTDDSADSRALRQELQTRSSELTELRASYEQLRERERDASDLATKREQQLNEAGIELTRQRHLADEERAILTGLRSELEVKTLEVEQLAAAVADLQRQGEEQREQIRVRDRNLSEVQRNLESAAADRDGLRRRLRSREQELEDVASAREDSGVELYKLRKELESASHTNERLEDALESSAAAADDDLLEKDWPSDAVDEVRRLRARLDAQVRRHAEQLAHRDKVASRSGDLDRLARLRLEADIRAQEQEYLLGLLDSAEQKIWEMNDAADRNAARVAAALAQLEKHREQADETLDELEVTRKLLSAAQARALEQERLLASERAKMARAGIGPDGLPPTAAGGGGGVSSVDDLFADIDLGQGATLDLEAETARPSRPSGGREAGAPEAVVADRDGSRASRTGRLGPRVVVEAIDSDEAWPEEGVVTAPDPDEN